MSADASLGAPRPVRDYYEDLWTRLPERLAPPQLELRADLLLGQLRPGLAMLDLGCGDGVFSELAIAHTPELSLTLADVADAALDRARRRPQLADAAEFARVPFDGALPFADGRFGLVWASEVIEHVADTATWLSEVRRVIAPGGTLALSTPNHTRLRLALGGVGTWSPALGDHLHLYDRASLLTLLDAFDFVDIDVRARGRLGRFSGLLCARARR